MAVITDRMPDRYHNAMVEWQRKHFKDYGYFVRHWADYYKQEPFRLQAKLGDLKAETIEVGERAGQRKFQRANELDEKLLKQVSAIIRAQASTELGSIQQHRETLDQAQDPKVQFDVLRIMAEEMRHGYQMLYLLATDDWGPNGQDIAQRTVDELLGMETGDHVLDAFNLYFDTFVDNIVFGALIDRVGKYQLQMQSVFAYAPMARSMGPMLKEESFHLATGVNRMKLWVREALAGTGPVSLDTLQRHINKWLPRGLEMFGDERGGAANVTLGLKNMINGEAAAAYYQECKQLVIDPLNEIIVQTHLPALSSEEAVALADRVLATGEVERGIRPEDLIRQPAVNFFRRRGQYAFEMVDVRGEPIANLNDYLAYLRGVLPESYVAHRDFATYVENLRKQRAGEEVSEAGLPFYG